MLTLKPRETIGGIARKIKPSLIIRMKHKYIAMKRRWRFYHDDRVLYEPGAYTICSPVLGDKIWVDGYYRIGAIAIAFVLSDSKEIVFYW